MEVTGPRGEVERLEHMISTVRKFDVMFFFGLVVPYNPFLRNLCFVNNYIHCFPVSGNGKEEIRGYGKFPVQG